MSVPPPPQHPPPRRQPHAPEDPSLTTQIFIDQSRAAAGRADAGQANAGGHRSADRGQQVPPAEDADTQALSPGDVAEARRRAAEDDGESTQMMSMEDLRQLAASSRIEALDGPREGRRRRGPGTACGCGGRCAGTGTGSAGGVRRARPVASGAVSTRRPSDSAARSRSPHAAARSAADGSAPRRSVHRPCGYPRGAGYAVQSGHPAPPAKPTAPPPAAGGGYAAARASRAGAAQAPHAGARDRVRRAVRAYRRGDRGLDLVDAVTRDGGQSQSGRTAASGDGRLHGRRRPRRRIGRRDRGAGGRHRIVRHPVGQHRVHHRCGARSLRGEELRLLTPRRAGQL